MVPPNRNNQNEWDKTPPFKPPLGTNYHQKVNLKPSEGQSEVIGFYH